MKFKVGDIVKQIHMAGTINHFVITDYRSDVNKYKVYWMEKDLHMNDWFPLANEQADQMFGYSFHKVEGGYVTN